MNIRTGHILRLIIVLGLISLFLLSVACKPLTKPRVFNLSGKVVLENDSGDPAFDNVNLSGIKVSLYKPASPDSIIARLKESYPILGPDMEQPMIFDPCKETPIKSTTTNTEGKYEFKGIAIGRYHLVFEKNGWGRVTEYYVHAGKSADRDGDDSLSFQLRRTTIMYPIVHLPAIVNNEFTFEHRHTYVVDGNVSFLAPVHFAGHSRVELAQGSNIDFFEDLIYDDIGNNFLTFTSLSDAPDGKAPPLWGAIRSHKENQTIRNWTVENSVDGIVVAGDHSSVKSCIIRDSGFGIHIWTEYAEIANIIFDRISCSAVSYSQMSSSEVIKQWLINCMFISCQEGLRTQGRAVEVANNYFIDNEYALFSTAGHHIIRNNAFDRNRNALIVKGSKICIEYNDFYHNTNSVILASFCVDGSPDPQFANNNFYQTSDFAFRISTYYLDKDIDAENNYWVAADIDAIIYDAVDNPLLGYKIIYLPKKAEVVESAGITNSP